MALSNPAWRPSPRLRRQLRMVAWLAAGVGLLLGIETVVFHLATDPLVDIRRYYEAGRRLNEGLPLYGQLSADTTATYLNPPLLAILFRPLALLPFPVAAAIWETLVIAALAVTLWRSVPRRSALLVAAWLALPIGWALVIGQAEVVLTLLLAIGAPWSVAAAGWVKLFPWLVAVYWLARREWRPIATMAAWIAGLFAVQVVIQPAETLAFLRLEWLNASFDVNQVSLWVLHPALWVAGVVIALALSLRYARTRAGWALAVVLTVAANPRLLVYQLGGLLAAFGGPADARERDNQGAAGHGEGGGQQ